MSARPAPHRALRFCVQLAKNSVRRLDTQLEVIAIALETNTRLTSAEQAEYRAAATFAGKLRDAFVKIAAMKPPEPSESDVPRKRGRPTKDDVAKWARRRAK